jgi:NADPH:quinone reductase
MSSSVDPSIPRCMKAEVIDRFGPPDVIRSAIIPVPDLGPNEVLVRVTTAGVGAWDPDLCAGEFADAGGGFPKVLGSDGAGIIAATGSDARRFGVGDAVYAWGFLNPKGGFYAEYTVVPEDEVSRIPPTLSVEEAGALAVDGLTALAGLDQLQIAPDTTLMVLGASGGVGHLALQLAKRIGARVFAVASGDDGVELARRLGAEEAVDGRSGEIATRVQAFAPDGLEAVLVLAGARTEELLGLVRPGGRVAYPNGVEPEPQSRPGIVLESFDGYHGREGLERLDALVAAGPFQVVLSHIYPLEETGRALRDVGRHHLGKLAVRVH